MATNKQPAWLKRMIARYEATAKQLGTDDQFVGWAEIWQAAWMMGVIKKTDNFPEANYRLRKMLFESGQCELIARGRYKPVDVDVDVEDEPAVIQGP
jgi:hypothetical protein